MNVQGGRGLETAARINCVGRAAARGTGPAWRRWRLARSPLPAPLQLLPFRREAGSEAGLGFTTAHLPRP